MQFWNSILTEKSWNTLLELRKKKFDFIVIGGWAAFLYTNMHKSKDIDIVINDFKDISFLKENYNLVKNDHLKKYEIKFEEIDLDIYVPFFSALAIPAEDIKDYTSTIQNFEVPKPELLLILKQGAEFDRESSVKGGKDRVDIMTMLFYSEIDFREYFRILQKYKLGHFYERLKKIISNFKDINYIGMNPRQLKLKKKEMLDKLRKL